jgi:hypothetical protein
VVTVGVRVFVCFNYYAGVEIFFFTVDFGARAESDPVGIFTDESNSSGSSEETRVDDLPEAAVSGAHGPVSGESILVRGGPGGGERAAPPRFANANGRTAGPAPPCASQV